MQESTKNDQLFRLQKFIAAKGKVNALCPALSPRQAGKEKLL